MSSAHWDQRFYVGTRGRILALLRRRGQSVEELAQALDLTGNAIRAHLLTLERDGFVQQRSVRARVGKPAFVYHLTPQAENLYPKAYEPVLTNLLDVLASSTGPEGLEASLRDAGRRMAAQHPALQGDPLTRVEAAAALLNDLGGLMEVEASDGELSLCGYSCPLSPVPLSHPQVCILMETMLEELTGLTVRERCERTENVACVFDFAPREA